MGNKPIKITFKEFTEDDINNINVSKIIHKHGMAHRD